ARFFGAEFGPAAMLPVLACFSVVAALLLLLLSKPTRAVEAHTPEATDVRSVTGSSYLKSIALLVILTGFSSTVVDFAFKTRISIEFSSAQALVSFFAIFYAVTSVVSIVLQLSAARWVLADRGLGLTLAVLPGSVFALAALAAAVPKAWVVVLLRGSGIAL